MQKFQLTNRHEDVFKWYGVQIELNLSFDNVLLLFKCLKDKELPFNQRLEIALKMLVVQHELLKQLDAERSVELILDILRDVLNIDLRKPPKIQYHEDGTEIIHIPTYDWDEDAGYIYASFLKDYGIDLFEQQGKLTWFRFLQLFKNLSDDSPMGQALYYRNCEMPKATKGNEEERKRIRKMKKKYELQCAKPFIDKRNKIEYEKRIKELKANRRKNN